MSEQQNNVHQFSTPNQQTGGGGGNGHDLHGRVSALEAHMQHLATKEDVQEIKTLIEQTNTRIEQTNTKIEQTNTKIVELESKLWKWVAGIIGAILISVLIFLIREWF